MSPTTSSVAGRKAWTRERVEALGLTTDVVTAGSILGIGRTLSYGLAKDGQFPIPVMKVGQMYKVSIFEILKALGLNIGSERTTETEATA